MSGERTEAPTQHRIDEARRKGQGVGRSHELSQVMTLVAGLLFVVATRKLQEGLNSLTGGPGMKLRGIKDGKADINFADADRWLRATLETVRECPCTHGCPSCVQSPKCGNGNEPLDKPGAVALLSAMLGESWG